MRQFFGIQEQFFIGLRCNTYENKEKIKEHKDDSVAFNGTGTGDDEEEEEDEEDEEVARGTSVNNIMHSIFSIVGVYINSQQVYNSNGLYTHKSYISKNFKGDFTKYKGILRFEGYDYEQDPEHITNALPDPFFRRRMKLLSRPDGFMLYGKLGIDFFSTAELLYRNMKFRQRFFRTRPSFYMISDNPNISLGIEDNSFYTRRIALKDDYHRKRMDMLAYAPVENN